MSFALSGFMVPERPDHPRVDLRQDPETYVPGITPTVVRILRLATFVRG